MIKCTPEEMLADGGYAGDPYEEARYTFEPVYDVDGETVVASVLHYSNSFESKNSTYDLFFGLGELKFAEGENTLTLSDPKEVKVYGLKTLNATGIANESDIDNSQIYVSWTTNVPVRLESEYTYQVYIDDVLVDDDATSGTTYSGYPTGEHSVKVVSIYNGANTSELTTTATIINEEKPDLVITDISVPAQEWFVDDTVPITITMKNIGNADAVVEDGNLTVHLFVNGVYKDYYTQDAVDGVQTLAAGKTLTKTINYKIEENLVDGEHNSSYVIKAVADADLKVTESNENNNEYERTFTFNARLNDLTLKNDGTNVIASWEPEDGAKQYALQYILNGEEKLIYVDGNTTEYIFPEGEEPDNNSEVNVYAQASDNSWRQIAEGTALADLTIESLRLENGVAFVNEENYIIAVVKNIGTAKANVGEGQDQITAVKFTNTDVYTGYGTRDNDILDPNKTFEIKINNGPYVPTSVGNVTLTAIADDINRIPESDRRNNTASIDVVAIARGTLELTNNEGTITATWTDPNVNDTDNTLVAEGYQLTYISNGVTITKDVNNGSFDFEDAIDNNTTVEISVKYEGIDGYHKLAETTALADLVIETITVPDNTYLNEAFDVVVTIKNQGTAQVPASSEEFVEGYGGWIVVAMQQNANYNNGNLMLGHTADGLLAGASANVTIAGVTGSVLSDGVTGDTLTFAVDSPWGIENPTSYIIESNEENNTKDATIMITAKPFEQQKMDWTPLYAQGDSENKERVLFTVANGTQNGYVEYKVLDTSFTDINYADLFTKYEGYNEGYTWMAMGIDNGHNVFAYDQATNKSTTSVNFQQVTSGFCNNYQPGDLVGMANILATQNWDIYDAYDHLVVEKGDSPLVYDANGFLFSLNSFALGKYYVMNIVDSVTNKYVTVAFRVMGETGSWIQAKSTNGPDDQIPIPYHEENMACTVNGKFYYDGSDLGLTVITVYNGDHLTLTTDTSMPIDLDNYKIEMAYASVDGNGNFVSPTDGFVTIKDGLGTEDQYRIQIKLPELIKDLPVHSEKGGLTDDEYYLMKVYPDANDPTKCIAIPVMIKAEIPMIEAVPSINATINPDSDDSSVLSISWSETINQAAYDYHYDLEIYASEEAYNNGESAIITEKDAMPGAAYTYDTIGYNLGTSVYVRVIANWCEQTIATATTAVEEYNPGWREISGDSQIDVHAGQTEKVSVLGTVSFYDDVKANHAYDVVGYNGMYINVAGNTSYYGPDEENSVPIDGTASIVYISKGVTTVAELAAMTEDDYSEANTYEQTAGQIKINTQNEFEVSYSTTYYNVKIVKGDKETIIKMKIEVTPGDVEVNAFQINTDTSEGGVSEFNPSFRVVSRASKVVAVGDPFEITDENGKPITNVAIGSVKSYGTLYTTNADGTVDTMKFGDTYPTLTVGKSEEIVENSGIFALEASELGKFNDNADLNSYFYALNFKFTTYMLEALDRDYTVRAYAVTEDGKIVYGDSVETTSIYDIAKVLYDNRRMSTEEKHNYLYDNILNIVAIKNNYLSIGKAMLKALNVKTYNDDYYLVNNAYKDLCYYANLAFNYKIDKYYNRGKFVCKTPTNGVETETALLARLNTVTTGGNQYASVAEWIENEVTMDKRGYEGFYEKVTYSSEQNSGNLVSQDQSK